jgi:hypothetical protein
MFNFKLDVAEYSQHWNLETAKHGPRVTDQVVVLLRGKISIESSFGTLLINGQRKFDLAGHANITCAEPLTHNNFLFRAPTGQEPGGLKKSILGVEIDPEPETIQSLGLIHFLPAYEDREMRIKEPDCIFCELRATRSLFDALLRWTSSPSTIFDHFTVRSHLSEHIKPGDPSMHEYYWSVPEKKYISTNAALQVENFSYILRPKSHSVSQTAC